MDKSRRECLNDKSHTYLHDGNCFPYLFNIFHVDYLFSGTLLHGKTEEIFRFDISSTYHFYEQFINFCGGLSPGFHAE